MTVQDAIFDALDAATPVYLQYRSFRADRRHEPVPRVPVGDVTADHALVLVVDALRLDAAPDLPFDWSAAVAPSTSTFPSITSMHTGLYPHENGADARERANDDRDGGPTQASAPVLPYAFEQAGFETYAGLGRSTAFRAVEGWYQRHQIFPDAPAERILDAYRRWRDGRDRTFAYLHLGDLHAPLDPPRSYVHADDVDTSLPNLAHLTEYVDSYDESDACRYYRDQRLALYRATASYVEDQLAEHLRPLLDDTVVLITGDHGEAHWEHVDVDRQMTDSRPQYGVGHGGTPLDAVARVPVAVSTPTGTVSIEGGVPSLRDVPRTLVDLLFPGVDADAPGLSWRDRIPADNVAVCEAPRYGVERKAAYRGEEKVIESRADGVVLGAAVGRDELGERFGTIYAEAIEALRDAFVWTDEAGEPTG